MMSLLAFLIDLLTYHYQCTTTSIKSPPTTEINRYLEEEQTSLFLVLSFPTFAKHVSALLHTHTHTHA